MGRCQEVTSDLSVYETNMNLLYDKLTALGFEVERPGGTFYIFPKALEEDANAFCLKAREFDLLLVPAIPLASRAMCALPTVSTPKSKAQPAGFGKAGGRLPQVNLPAHAAHGGAWLRIEKPSERKGNPAMEKIKMTTPLVEMDGDEMTPHPVEDDQGRTDPSVCGPQDRIL